MDRQAEPVGQRHQNTALRGPVKLGHHKARDIGDLAEDIDLGQRILAGGGVQHQKRVVRCLGVLLADDADDLGQFLHQVLTVL